MKPKNPNAKNRRWEPPVELSGVSPDAYDKNIDSGRGSARGKRLKSGPPNYTLPGHPSSEETTKRR